MSTRIAIVGTGGVGSYVGGHMTKAGHDVTMIDQYPAHVEAMRTTGLNVSGILPRDNFTVRTNALHLSEAQGLAKQKPIDIAFITIKSFDTRWAAALIKQYLAPDGFVCSLQNAINEERIAEVVGWGKTLGVTIAGCGVDLFAPGHVKRTQVSAEGHVVFRAGEIHGGVTARAEEVARVLAAADASKVTTNLWGERWSKLIVNAMRNGLAAVSLVNIPEQDRNPITRAIMIRLGGEAVRVGQALGYELVTTQGMVPETLARASEGDRAAIDEITANLLKFADTFDPTMPSMGQDIQRGRRTEVDEINGMIAQKGREAGIPTPANTKLAEVIKKVERGEIERGIDALDGV